MKMSGKVKETEGEVRVRPRCVGSGTGVVLWLPFFFFFFGASCILLFPLFVHTLSLRLTTLYIHAGCVYYVHSLLPILVLGFFLYHSEKWICRAEAS